VGNSDSFFSWKYQLYSISLISSLVSSVIPGEAESVMIASIIVTSRRVLCQDRNCWSPSSVFISDTVPLLSKDYSVMTRDSVYLV
jgi:hypothetical protein